MYLIRNVNCALKDPMNGNGSILYSTKLCLHN